MPSSVIIYMICCYLASREGKRVSEGQLEEAIKTVTASKQVAGCDGKRGMRKESVCCARVVCAVQSRYDPRFRGNQFAMWRLLQQCTVPPVSRTLINLTKFSEQEMTGK